jgi:hypothetical protein
MSPTNTQTIDNPQSRSPSCDEAAIPPREVDDLPAYISLPVTATRSMQVTLRRVGTIAPRPFPLDDEPESWTLSGNE